MLSRETTSPSIATADDSDYIAGLSETERNALLRRNVFPLGMSVAAHQVLQMVGLVTGLERVGGIGPQMYHAYPGYSGSARGNVRGRMRIPRSDRFSPGRGPAFWLIEVAD